MKTRVIQEEPEPTEARTRGDEDAGDARSADDQDTPYCRHRSSP